MHACELHGPQRRDDVSGGSGHLVEKAKYPRIFRYTTH